MLRLGDLAPNFKAVATGCDQEIDFHEWAGKSWAILFSHPADFSMKQTISPIEIFILFT